MEYFFFKKGEKRVLQSIDGPFNADYTSKSILYHINIIVILQVFSNISPNLISSFLSKFCHQDLTSPKLINSISFSADLHVTRLSLFYAHY